MAKKKPHLPPLPGYPVKKPFQTMEELETYFAQDGLPCLLCGRTYLALHLHLNKTHEMALDDYRARYGIPWTRGLVAKSLGDTFSANMKQRHQDGLIRPSPLEHLAFLQAAAKERRPSVRAVITRQTREALQVYGRTEPLGPKDFEEFLRRIKTGRTITEVCQDSDMPSRRTFEKYRQHHPAFQKQLDAVWERLPFAVQLRGLRTGERFRRTVVDLRLKNLSWRQIGRMMNVSPKTVQATWFRLKRQG